jgi:hypothetical protein
MHLSKIQMKSPLQSVTISFLDGQTGVRRREKEIKREIYREIERERERKRKKERERVRERERKRERERERERKKTGRINVHGVKKPLNSK